MEIDKEKLKGEIVIAKKIIASIVNFKDKDRIGSLQRKNKEICLVVAEFKCQKCGKKEDLQVHHLIMRKAKEFMDFYRYASQRYYWANQIILCKECHHLYHTGMKGKMDNEEMVLSEKEIERIKRKFSK